MTFEAHFLRNMRSDNWRHSWQHFRENHYDKKFAKLPLSHYLWTLQFVSSSKTTTTTKLSDVNAPLDWNQYHNDVSYQRGYSLYARNMCHHLYILFPTSLTLRAGERVCEMTRHVSVSSSALECACEAACALLAKLPRSPHPRRRKKDRTYKSVCQRNNSIWCSTKNVVVGNKTQITNDLYKYTTKRRQLHSSNRSMAFRMTFVYDSLNSSRPSTVRWVWSVKYVCRFFLLYLKLWENSNAWDVRKLREWIHEWVGGTYSNTYHQHQPSSSAHIAALVLCRIRFGIRNRSRRAK